MSVINQLEAAFNAFANFMWSTPLVVLLVGGGIGLMLYSRFRPYYHLGHSLALLRGCYNDEHDPGHVSHAQALSTALSGTLGLGNVAGVAIAISAGGPGAVFWMWVTAIIGVTTKFYTASLAVMYRGRDSSGVLRGGPMYVIREGLGKCWYPLAVLFAVAGVLGTLPLFQTNQLVSLLREVVAIPIGLATESQHMTFDITAGVVLAILALLVVLGRIERIGKLTVRLVPSMLLLYIGMTLIVLIRYWRDIPEVFMLIVNDAFNGASVAGGALGTVIMIGVRRGAFSNEAGIGTESMAHGEAKTSEPIREGVVAMTGPIIDTLIVCSCTAFMILLTGVWQTGGDMEGVALTAAALEKVFPHSGIYLLLLMVALLSFSTIVTFWFYGSKCVGFLLGADKARYYTPLYLLMIVVGAVTTLELVNGLLIGMYAMMAIPTMVSTFLLAPRVNEAAHHYFRKMDSLAQ
jgi:AGCS family alanine or glycine:cation symporter